MRPVHLANPDLQVRKVSAAILESAAALVIPDRKVPRVPSEIRVSKATKVLKARRELLDLVVSRDPPASQALQDREETLVRQAVQDHQGLKDPQDNEVSLASLDPRVMSVGLDGLASRVRRVIRVRSDSLVHKASINHIHHFLSFFICQLLT